MASVATSRTTKSHEFDTPDGRGLKHGTTDEVNRPFDPDLRYTVTVPVEEIQRAMQLFLTLLGETMRDARKTVGDKTGQDGNQAAE